MTNQLFIEIDKFDSWAKSQFDDMPQNDIGGEWECDYEKWEDIYKSFENFVLTTDPQKLTDIQKNRLLYIIARDNEAEHLSEILSNQFLIVLSEHSISNGHRDDKWQLAIQLYKLTDKQKALTLLEKFVNDDDEYVSRRSLMELAKLKSEKVEFYAEKFWNRENYGDSEEYKKIAVLHSLKIINSKLLDIYIELAKQSGQKYLIMNANQIESEKACL
jgi:Na+/phosphate symporter